MIDLKKMALASLFVATSAFAQDGKLKGLLIDDASVGVEVGANKYMGDSDLELGYGLNYTKQINSLFALKGGYFAGTLTDQTKSEEYTALTVEGLVNLSNLSVGASNTLKVYLSTGLAFVTVDDKDDSSLVPNLGAGVKYAINESFDLDLSTSLGLGTLSGEDLESHMTVGLGVNYRFTKKEASVEWNNPLDAMYGDLSTVKTELEGLSTDSDGDGVSDRFDNDNNTPEGVAVDGRGNALDVDMDGVADYADEDPFTARGVQLDANGRELDSDKDGVANSLDIEPNSPSGATVNFQGKEIKSAKGAFMPAIYFDYNSAKVSYANYERLAAVAALLQANPNYTITVVGYADTVGNSANNHKIALRRANSVIDALTSMFGINASRLSADSKGEDAPLANESVKVTETTADGQVISNSLSRMNRRVEFVID